jgi:hypothetical protein
MHQLTLDLAAWCQRAGVKQAYVFAGCRARTCSLECSRAHKERARCSGKRAREAFVPLKDYDERNLLSDYRFVEEAIETRAAAERRLAAAPRSAAGAPERLPQHLQALVRAAKQAGVALRLMSPGVPASPAPRRRLH